MYSCAYDPGLALFLAEQASVEGGPRPGAVEWGCAAAALAFLAMALVIPA